MTTQRNAEFSDVYQDLKDFKETRASVKELLEYRKKLIDQEHSDLARINEIKWKAMEAIDNLFAEDAPESSEK